MPAFFNINDIRVIDSWHDIVVVQCDVAEIDETVDFSHQCGIELYRSHKLGRGSDKFVINFIFNNLNSLFST